MAVRPWVTPKEVRAYSERESVKKRASAKLAIDISRAEMYVIAYTRNSFDDELYNSIPEPVKTAVILLAETYAAGEAEPVEHGGNYSHGSNDDYSFTMADATGRVDSLDLSALLDDYIVEKQSGSVTMIMRKI